MEGLEAQLQNSRRAGAIYDLGQRWVQWTWAQFSWVSGLVYSGAMIGPIG